MRAEQGAASPPLPLQEQAGAAAAVVECKGRTTAAVVELLYGLHGGRREEQATRGEKEAGTQTSSAHRSPARGGLYLSLLRPPSSPPRRGCSSLTSPRALRLSTSLPPPRVLRRGAFPPRFLLRESSTLHGVNAVASAKPRSAAPGTYASAYPCGLTQVVMSG